MTLLAADGTITLTTGAIGTTFTVSGLSFQPKAIILFWSGRATTGQGEADHMFGVGVATGTASRRSYTSQSDHANTTMNTSSQWDNDCCVSTLTIAGALDGKADLDAILSDGFRLIIDDVFSAGLQVGWIAYGGTDLTDAEIIDFVVPGATGNVNYATSFALDTGADDKAVFFLGCSATGGSGVGRAHSDFMFGASAGNTPVNAVTFGGSYDALGTSNTASYCRNGDCIAIGDGDGIYKRASLTAWLSTGFTLNWAEVDATLNRLSALVLKGGRWQVGDSVTSTGTTNQTEATSYVPKALLIGSHGKTASTSDVSQAVDERIIGVATSATSRRCAAMIDKDAAASADIGVAYSEVAMYINQSTAATIVQEGAMDLVSFDATPGFTFVMDDADPAAAFFWYLLAADAPASGTTISIGLGTLTLSALTATQNLSLPISLGAVSLTGYLPSISLNENLGIASNSLVISGVGVTLSQSLPIGVANPILTGFIPQLSEILPLGLGSVTLTGYGPSLLISENISIAAGTLTLSGYSITSSELLPIASATVTLSGAVTSLNTTLPLGLGVATLTGYIPSLLERAVLGVGVGAITLQGFSSTISQELDLGTPASITLSGYIQSLSSGAGSVAITNATLLFTGHVSSLELTSVAIGGEALQFSGFAPAITVNERVAIGSSNVLLGGLAPELNSSNPILFGSVSLTGYAPGLATSVSTVAIGPAGLALSGYVQSLITSSPEIGIGVGSLTFTGLSIGVEQILLIRDTDLRSDVALSSQRSDVSLSSVRSDRTLTSKRTST